MSDVTVRIEFVVPAAEWQEWRDCHDSDEATLQTLVADVGVFDLLDSANGYTVTLAQPGALERLEAWLQVNHLLDAQLGCGYAAPSSDEDDWLVAFIEPDGEPTEYSATAPTLAAAIDAALKAAEGDNAKP